MIEMDHFQIIGNSINFLIKTNIKLALEKKYFSTFSFPFFCLWFIYLFVIVCGQLFGEPETFKILKMITQTACDVIVDYGMLPLMERCDNR
jgi:hypothetical protein